MHREYLLVSIKNQKTTSDSGTAARSNSSEMADIFFVHNHGDPELEGYERTEDDFDHNYVDHNYGRDYLWFSSPRITSDDLDHVRYFLDSLSAGDNALFLSQPLDIHFVNLLPDDMFLHLWTAFQMSVISSSISNSTSRLHGRILSILSEEQQ